MRDAMQNRRQPKRPCNEEIPPGAANLVPGIQRQAGAEVSSCCSLKRLGTVLLTAGLLGACGCGSGKSSSALQVGTITFTDVNGTPAAHSLQVLTQGQSTYLAIALSDDPQGLGADWSVYCGSAPPPGTPLPPGQTQDKSCGAFVPAHTRSGPVPGYATGGAGYVTLYTAPASPPKTGNVTLYATSTSDPSRTSTATLAILSKYISVQFEPAPPATLAVSADTQLTVVVANDPTNAGVTWTAACTQNTLVGCGSFNPATTLSGVATAYTAPPTVPTGSGAMQITATSVADPTKAVTATITITGAGS